MVAPTDRMESLSSGVSLFSIQPGGSLGPDRTVIDCEDPGGGIWGDFWELGYPSDPWRMLVPEVRMPPNQYWPAHWHDAWIAVIIWDGTILFGDWWMKRGDILISPSFTEYGPLLNGPRGCQLFEVFARDPLDATYAPEYHDHPTLEYVHKASGAAPVFGERPAGSEGNEGNQITPLGEIPGLITGHFDGTGLWNLGDPGDPERGVVFETQLPASGVIASHSYSDWHAFMVYEGSMSAGDREVPRDGIVLVEPNAKVPELVAGESGVHLIEIARTASGLPRQ